ncbi:MAG: hypothetical protein AB1505_13995 [Candidatus Latescibacterota bacterium]
MAYQSRRIEDYRLLMHDEGEPPLRQSWPPTVEGLKRATKEGIEGYPFDAYSYGINCSCGAYHPSAVLDRMGHGVGVLKDTGTWTIAESMRRLEAQGLNPTAIVVEACHEIGLDVVLRVRMNDLHDIFYFEQFSRPDRPPKTPREPGWYYMCPHKQQHPELLLGTPAPGPRTRAEVEAYAYNYALGPVRQRQYRFVEETANTYDLDGLLIDFMRWPHLFKQEEAYAQRHLFTAYMQRLRACVQEAAGRRGRPIHFVARLPETLDVGLRMGLDIRAWLEQGILDLVVIGAGYNPFGTPWAEIAGEAGRHGVPALVTIRSMGEPPHYGGDVVELYYRRLRAGALRAYRHGAAGLELFNYFYHLPFYEGSVGGPGAGTGFAFTHDIRDPQRLAALPRTYECSRQFSLDYIYGHACFPGQLPCSIGRAEDGLSHVVTLDIPERLPDDARARLWLQLVDLGHEHELEVSWNGRPLPFDLERDRRRRGSTNLAEVTFALSPAQVVQGENRLGLRLLHRPAELDPFITLSHALLHVDPPGPEGSGTTPASA